MSSVYDHPRERTAVRTAPFDEAGSRLMPDHGQRDDAEATHPDDDSTRTRMAPGLGDVQDGFYWGKTATTGAPIIKPTKALIEELAGKLEAAYEHDERDRQMDIDKAAVHRLNEAITRLKRKTKFRAVATVAQQIDNNENVDFDTQLDGLVARLEQLDAGWLGKGIIRAIAQQAAQDAANNLYWFGLHAQIQRGHEDRGNEQAAENSCINKESSRTQFLVAMQLMIWAEEAGFAPDFRRAAQDALGLNGWSQTQRMLNNRQSVREQARSTIDDLYDMSSPKTPEENAEMEDDDLDEALGT